MLTSVPELNDHSLKSTSDLKKNKTNFLPEGKIADETNEDEPDDELNDVVVDLKATLYENADFDVNKLNEMVSSEKCIKSNFVNAICNSPKQKFVRMGSKRKESKFPIKQLVIWPELWEKVRNYFGVKCIYWFRDSPLIGHWKNISNMKAWDYMIFEYIYIIKGKKINSLNNEFDPVNSEGWNDFILKPYIGQGCRFFRRDVRIWLSDNKSEISKIFKNVSKAVVPSEVLLILKQLLSFEQNYSNLHEAGFFERPSFDADLESEAERRLNLMKSFYNPEHEVWTDHESIQFNRTGIPRREKTVKRKSELSIEEERINKIQKTSSISSRENSISETDIDEEDIPEDDSGIDDEEISTIHKEISTFHEEISLENSKYPNEIIELINQENSKIILMESRKYFGENISHSFWEKGDGM
ncbi:hypothetical protein HDU92_002690 [Lobulomyces angularis]|nr:hypothetical protein HDU92_002690 [Lobulomyces angularis]